MGLKQINVCTKNVLLTRWKLILKSANKYEIIHAIISEWDPLFLTS